MHRDVQLIQLKPEGGTAGGLICINLLIADCIIRINTYIYSLEHGSFGLGVTVIKCFLSIKGIQVYRVRVRVYRVVGGSLG